MKMNSVSCMCDVLTGLFVYTQTLCLTPLESSWAVFIKFSFIEITWRVLFSCIFLVSYSPMHTPTHTHTRSVVRLNGLHLCVGSLNAKDYEWVWTGHRLHSRCKTTTISWFKRFVLVKTPFQVVFFRSLAIRDMKTLPNLTFSLYCKHCIVD